MSGFFTLQLIDKASSSPGRLSVLTQFQRDAGDGLVRDVLTKAGLASGEWKLILLERTKGSPGMATFQPRRTVVNGVACKIKPGDNGSAVDAVLCPPHGSVSNLECYKRLSDSINSQPGYTYPDDVAPEDESPIVGLLRKYRDRLELLANAPERLIDLDKTRQELQAKIDGLRKQIEVVETDLAAVERDRGLILNIEPAALALLLGE